MFEDIPAAKTRPPLNRKLVAGAAAAVLVLGSLGYLYWRHSNQEQARQTLTRVNQALAAYYKRHDGYPDTLGRLRGKEEGPPETAPAEQARLLEAPLARDSFQQSGYRFRYQPGPLLQRWAATVRLHAGYVLTAKPVGPGAGFEWFYYSDQSGEVRARKGATPSPDDPIAK